MRTVQSIDDLNLPYRHKGFLNHFLAHVSEIKEITKVILFGSCASGQIEPDSDIDLLVLTEHPIPIDTEFHIMSNCPPAYDEKFYLSSDIIVDFVGNYNRFKDVSGMVQKAIEREGVDLSGLIR